MKSHPVVYKLAREIVPLAGIAEIILATYIGYSFGTQETARAWLLTGVLALIGYSSSRLWVWLMEKMTGGK